MIKKLIWLLIAVLLLSSCSDPKQELHKYSYFAFGTIIKLTIAGVDKSTADQAANDLEVKFNQWHADWHAWQPGMLVAINQQLADGKTVKLDQKILPLLQRAKELAAMSSDTFNPAMGNLLALWGYQGSDEPEKPPEKAVIDEYLQTASDLSALEIKQDLIRSDSPNIQFDLGGFAKGYGVDLALNYLQSMGIKNALLDAGGDLKVIGQRVDRPWRIGIRHPRKVGVLASLDVNDGESVFTSGDYERYFMHEGQRYHHILDPRTGYPASDFISVTIVTEDASLADAAATALFVAGLKDWQKVAVQMGVDKVMLIDNQGKIHMTPELKPRMKLTVDHLEL
ncbi:MAG: FAD:protein FMN transferase [Gammaproteobacteria bacterium]